MVPSQLVTWGLPFLWRGGHHSAITVTPDATTRVFVLRLGGTVRSGGIKTFFVALDTRCICYIILSAVCVLKKQTQN